LLHKYKLNNLNIVIDVNSGSVHVFDEIAYDVVDFIERPVEAAIKALADRYAKEDLTDVYSELKQLEEQGQLNSPDTYKEAVLNNKKEILTKALCLNIAHDCNIRCGYCFASTGDYHGGRKLMSLEVAKGAIDFLLETSGNRKRLEVDFFGGEPLMNFDVIKEAVKYGRERQKEFNKRIGFTITTNGTLLDKEAVDFFNENMDNVVVSIDGRKSVNDRMRKFTDGRGTFDEILPKIKDFVAARGDKSYYIRGTFTANNLDFSDDVIFLADQGFKEISIEPVVAEENKGYALKEEHLPIIFAEYEKLSDRYLQYQKEGKGFRYYHFLMDLDGGPCVYKRVSSCGSGVEYFAVTPGGELYPCHQFVGREEYLMGTIKDGVTNKELQKEFDKNNVYKLIGGRDSVFFAFLAYEFCNSVCPFFFPVVPEDFLQLLEICCI
jgi:uncharacterized protein